MCACTYPRIIRISISYSIHHHIYRFLSYTSSIDMNFYINFIVVWVVTDKINIANIPSVDCAAVLILVIQILEISLESGEQGRRGNKQQRRDSRKVAEIKVYDGGGGGEVTMKIETEWDRERKRWRKRERQRGSERYGLMRAWLSYASAQVAYITTG